MLLKLDLGLLLKMEWTWKAFAEIGVNQVLVRKRTKPVYF